MSLRMVEWETVTGRHMVNFPKLVGKDKAWLVPMRLMGVTLKDFVITLKGTYKADINFYKDSEGNLSWIGYSFPTLTDCRKFKNYINKLAREQGLEEKNYMEIIRRK